MNTTVNFSVYQNNFFNFVKTESGNAIVNAVAGSGKTFTLLQAMKFVNGSNNIFLAFNKSIQVELESKVPSNITCKTLHSLGLSIFRSRFGRYKIDNRKVDFKMSTIPALTIEKSMTSKEMALTYKKRDIVKKLVSLCKNTLIDYNNKDALLNLSIDFSIDFEEFDINEIFGSIPSIMSKCQDDTYCIDFDDMIYLPVFYKLSSVKFDNIFVDESQDLNKCQMELILSIGKVNSRYFVVGDPHQSIYGFRGADSSSMSRLQEVLNAKDFPLSICYRCPESHIALAKDIVSHIESKPNASQGEIIRINESQIIESFQSNVSSNPLVLCRKNSPLVSFALQCISKGIKASIKGKDIGENLIHLVNKMEATNIEDLFCKLDEYESTETEKLLKRRNDAGADILSDKVSAIKAIAESSNSINDIIDTIQRLFSDTTSCGIIFSTIHKAKGLENNVVYIVKPQFIPLSRKGQKEWEIVQERNLQYVAYTRSKDKLIFVKE